MWIQWQCYIILFCLLLLNLNHKIKGFGVNEMDFAYHNISQFLVNKIWIKIKKGGKGAIWIRINQERRFKKIMP